MFCFLQEHWLPHHEAVHRFENDFKGYKFLSTSADMFTRTEDKMLQSGPTWHGSAIGWDESIDKHISKLPVISERFCGVSYSDKQTSIIAYTAYLPTSGQDDEFLDVLAKLSFDIKSNVALNTSILIGLDSNQSDKSSRRRSEAMKTFREDFLFKSILLDKKATFHHNNQTSMSQIDHILYFVPEEMNIKVNLHKHLCLLENFSNLSSHDALVGNIVLPISKETSQETDYSSTYESFLVPKPQWNEAGLCGYQEQSAEVLKNLITQFPEPENIPILCELFSKMLVIAAESNFETISPKNKTSNKSKDKKTVFSP